MFMPSALIKVSIGDFIALYVLSDKDNLQKQIINHAFMNNFYL